MCSACPTGSSSPAGSRSITDCTCISGYFDAGDGAGCTASTTICVDGSQKDPLTDTCSSCPANTYCIGGVLHSCAADKVSASGSSTCLCSDGYSLP